MGIKAIIQPSIWLFIVCVLIQCTPSAARVRASRERCNPPCLHDGRCRSNRCNCREGYTGNDCGTSIDDAFDSCTIRPSNPCGNGGTCVPVDTTYKCVCPDGYKGKNCQIGPCSQNPCLHMGTCSVVNSAAFCTCPLGWGGDRCEIEMIWCGDVEYDPLTQVCCGTTIKERIFGERTECCGDGLIDSESHLCCLDVAGLRQGGDRAQCCGDVPYDPNEYMCCNGNVNEITESPDLSVCCGSFTMNKETHLCHNNIIFKRIHYGGPVVCGSTVYNPNIQLCCKGYSNDMTSNTDECCHKTVFTPGKALCCYRKVKPIADPRDYCCGSRIVRVSRKQMCCINRKYKIAKGMECCGNMYYATSKSLCCHDNTIHTKGREPADCFK